MLILFEFCTTLVRKCNEVTFTFLQSPELISKGLLSRGQSIYEPIKKFLIKALKSSTLNFTQWHAHQKVLFFGFLFF